MDLEPVLDAAQVLPAQSDDAILVGRAWIAGDPGGPSPVLVRGDAVFDLSALAPTSSPRKHLVASARGLDA